MPIYMLFPGGLRKTFTLSYDDGVRQDKRLVDIFDKYALKATFNINSGLLGDEQKSCESSGRMSLKEIIELYSNGNHEVAIHGLEHTFIDKLHTSVLINELIQDRKNLESIFGMLIRGMAYPYGAFSDNVVDALRMCGIAYSRTTNATERFEIPHDWLRLEPTCHHSAPNLQELADRFISLNPRMAQMFYVWGHSYEFDEDTKYNSWDVIENFAEKISGHDDIWYATNIEIYDYVKAFNSLLISADSKIIHNPTSTDVWLFNVVCHDESEPYCVKAGETIILK